MRPLTRLPVAVGLVLPLSVAVSGRAGDLDAYDVFPCDTGDGIVELGDVLGVLAAYSGDYACSCPASGGWDLMGNAGTDELMEFIGTTDNMSFNVRVNNQRVMRFEPDATAPNVIGGFSANAAALGVSGAAICGGGAEGMANLVNGDHSVIGGGHGNETGLRSTIGGGHDNLASGTNATISGGENNTASGYAGVIGGGAYNVASGGWSTVGGGNANTASGAFNATVSGGNFNEATADQATVGGGSGNTASGTRSTLGGGQLNTASGNASTVSGGSSNTASGVASTVCGGLNNAAGGDYSFAAGRQAKVRDSTQGGGFFGDEGTFVWADSETADFVSTGANQFLIRASGGVGIGTNAPSDQLDVLNALRVTREGATSQFVQLNTAGAGGHFLYGYSSGSNRKFLGIGSLHDGVGAAGSTGITFYVGNQAAPTEVMRITENGRVGIRDTSPSVELDVIGSINYTGVITDVSDERLKENITPVENALAKLQQLRGVYFNMKDTPTQRDVGLIAQNVQEVLPEAVRVIDPEAGYLGVSYPALVPLLVEAIKEAESREAAKDRRIAALEARLERLEAMYTIHVVP